MANTDSRIPVLFVSLELAGAEDAVLTDANSPAVDHYIVARLGAGSGGHAVGCNCCVWRSSAAQAMTTLYHARARGELPLFRRLIVDLPANGAAEVRAALAEDRFVAARFYAA